MAMKCCERPRLSDFGLSTPDSSVFYRSQWHKLPIGHVIFVVYRVIVALYMLGILIAYLINQIEFYGGQAFIYLTNLGFIVFVVYLQLAGAIAVIDGCILKDRSCEDMGIRHKVHWVIFNITVNTNILVTMIYWGALYNPEFNFFYDFHVHTATTIISLIDVFVTAIPVRVLHLIHPMAFDVAYLILTLIFWGAGGRTISTNGAVYPFLDYSNSPGLAAGVIVGVFVAVAVMQIVIWALYKLRMWMWLKRGNSEAEDGEVDKMEEGL